MHTNETLHTFLNFKMPQLHSIFCLNTTRHSTNWLAWLDLVGLVCSFFVTMASFEDGIELAWAFSNVRQTWIPTSFFGNQWSFVSVHGIEGSITEGSVLLKAYFMDWGLVFSFVILTSTPTLFLATYVLTWFIHLKSTVSSRSIYT